MSAPPGTAKSVFGPALPAAQRYAELLVGAGAERGLVGPVEAPRIWERHLLNSAVVAELVPAQARTRESLPYPEAGLVLADVGSGAGLPGIVLAILLPEVRVVLVESMARRTAFLSECVDDLGLRNVDVVRGRAEDLSGQLGADVVTARAVARLDRLAVLAAGLARPGGLVLAIKGATVRQELDEAMPVLRRLGASAIEVVRAGVGVVSEPATVVRFVTSSSHDLTRAVPGAARRRAPARLPHGGRSA